MQCSFPVRQGTLLDLSRFFSILIDHIKKFKRFSIDRYLSQLTILTVYQLHGKEWMIFRQKLQKQFVTFPEIQLPDLFLRNPFQNAFVAGNGLPCKAICSKNRNIFHLISADKGELSAIMKRRQCIACLFFDFSQNTFLRAFAFLKMSADSDPFSFIDILFLYHSVQHQVFAVFFDIT